MTTVEQRPLWADEQSPLEARWWTFHLAHPEVATALATRARALLDRGHRHIGIAMLWETLRYETLLGAGPNQDTYRLNNTHRAYYARWLMETHADLAGVFETRELRS
jgi:hypothetical protein